MSILRRVWNGRLAGLPSAGALAAAIAFRQLHNSAATVFWRTNLGALGAGSIIQAGVTIRYPGNIEIGHATSVGRGATIAQEFSDGRCVIGNDVIIAVDVRLDFSGDLQIGNDVVVSAGATLLTHSHGRNPKSSPQKTPLVIEDGVWIGTNVIVIEGVSRIGRGSVIAAGAVVTRPVAPHSIMAGVPAKVIGSNASGAFG